MAEPHFLPQGCPWHRPSSRAFTARLLHPCKSPPLCSRCPQPPSQQAHSSRLSAGPPDGRARAPYAFCMKKEAIRKMSEGSKAKAWLQSRGLREHLSSAQGPALTTFTSVAGFLESELSTDFQKIGLGLCQLCISLECQALCRTHNKHAIKRNKTQEAPYSGKERN